MGFLSANYLLNISKFQDYFKNLKKKLFAKIYYSLYVYI